MREIVKADLPTRREVWPRDKAITHFEGYRRALQGRTDSRAFRQTKTSRSTCHGDWHDLCRGPHFALDRKIGDAFKLTKIAGAYWRGDQERAAAAHLRHRLARRERTRRLSPEARRSRRSATTASIGKELELFTFSPDVGAGLPLWMPNGMVIRQELEFLALQEERKEGYRRVATPHIAKEALYYRSRHLPYYNEGMYAPLDIDGENYYLRPMNCPHHHLIYRCDAAFLSRAADADCGIRPGLSLRSVRRFVGADARARLLHE